MKIYYDNGQAEGRTFFVSSSSHGNAEGDSVGLSAVSGGGYALLYVAGKAKAGCLSGLIFRNGVFRQPQRLEKELS